jgi:hypothetical protein
VEPNFQPFLIIFFEQLFPKVENLAQPFLIIFFEQLFPKVENLAQPFPKVE